MFGLAVIAAGIYTLPGVHPSRFPFNHHYPSAPATVAELTGRPLDPVPSADVIANQRISSLTDLELALPVDAVIARGTTLRLLRPVLFGPGALVDINGPGTIALDRGSFLEAVDGSRVKLRDLTIASVGNGSDRAFVLDAGGLLSLLHDEVVGLGRNATLARGISFDRAAAGSSVSWCVIRTGLDGIFVTASRGVVIDHNEIVNSSAFGIELHGNVDSTMITHNQVVISGASGIVMSGDLRGDLVSSNTVDDARAYGVLVYGVSAPVSVTHNWISHVFDGVVVNYSSNISVRANTVFNVTRFAIRLSGKSRGNLVANNSLRSSPVGIYAVNGSRGNRLLYNTFRDLGENIRIRASARGNEIFPAPANSEINGQIT